MAVWTRVQGLLAGAALGGAARSAFEGVFEVSKQNAWARRPFRTLPVTTAAAALARRIVTREQAVDDARRDGFGVPRLDVLAELSRSYPELATALELWRRGITERGEFEKAMRRGGYPDDVIDQLAALRTVLAAPSDVIRWAVREAFNPPLAQSLGFTAEFPAAFADYAARLGIPEEDARRHWIAHWQLPSATQGADMLHRGIIGDDEYRELLKALDYPLPWRQRLIRLARRIPPLSDLIRFSVREVYQDATAAKYGYDADYPADFTRDAALHGMAPDRAKQYWRAHWRLPSVAQGYRMLYRGLINEGELDDLLRIQDYPSFWRSRLLGAARIVPGRIDLRRTFVAGLRTRAQTKAGYQRLGYAEADAELLTQLAEADKERAAASGEGGHVVKAKSQLWTTAHRSYIMGESSATLARAKLTAIGVPPDDRDSIIRLWDHERELRRRQLTPAQVKKAWQAAVLNRDTGLPWTRDDARAALIERGFDADDAEEYLDLPTKSA